MKRFSITSLCIAFLMPVVNVAYAQAGGTGDDIAEVPGDDTGAARTPRVTVLGITSQINTEAADAATESFRRSVDTSGKLTHSGREVTLAQMILAFQCEEPPDDACLSQIGSGLESDYLIVGDISESTEEGYVNLTVRLYDVNAGSEKSRIENEPWPLESAMMVLDTTSNAIILRLMGEAGDMLVRSEMEGSEVIIDDAFVGNIKDGKLIVRSLDLGTHTVVVKNSEGLTAEKTVEISAPGILEEEFIPPEPEPVAQEAPPEEEPVPVSPPPEKTYTWTIVGASLLGGGLFVTGVGLGLGLYVEVLDRDPVLDDYRRVTPPGQGVCSYAESQDTDQANEVSDICTEAESLQFAHYALIGVGALAAIGGIVVLALDLDSRKQDSGDSGNDSAKLMLSPVIGAGNGGVSAVVEF